MAPTRILLATVALLALFSVSASAQPMELATAMLNGSNSVPPVTTMAMGNASISADGETFTFTIKISDITNLTMIHIHAGDASTSGPVVVPLVPTPADDAVDGMLATPLSTSGSQPLDIETTFGLSDLAGDLAGMSADEFATAMTTGDYYVNVHTTGNPAGVIRGQLMMVQGGAPASAPSPSMMSPSSSPMMSPSPSKMSPSSSPMMSPSSSPMMSPSSSPIMMPPGTVTSPSPSPSPSSATTVSALATLSVAVLAAALM